MRDPSTRVWIVLGVVLLGVLNLPASTERSIKAAVREGISPLQSVVTSASRTIRETLKTPRGLGGITLENRRLASEVIALRNEVWALRELERENMELRNQLAFLKKVRYELIPAEAIARDVSGWWQTIRLNKGRSHGVETNQAVITTDGVIGKTIDVSFRTCDVLLLSDVDCKVAVRINRINGFGVISGRGLSWNRRVELNMDFINKNLPVRSGDEVVTSGLGGVFPKGLVVGYVDKVTRAPSGLYQQAHIIPKADLNDLSYVFIVTSDALEKKT